MKEKKAKISKGKLRAIIVAAVSAAVAVALIVTNFFIPVKYLSSYLVLRNKGAKAGIMRVRFVDVGYGDCTIIELPDGKNMLIDGGDGSSSNVSRILKFLNKCDIGTIDYLVCSSVYGDHCGGLSDVIAYKTVKKIFMPYCTNIYVTDEYRDFVRAAKSCGAELYICENGAGFEGENYKFVLLSPSAHTNGEGQYADLNADPSSENAKGAASAVAWLEYAGTSFLFTGHANAAALEYVCNSYETAGADYPADLNSLNVIEVAGHGNESSVYDRLYQITSPELAILSSSGFVSVQAINLVSDRLYRTDEYGTVTIEVSAEGYAVI